MERDDKRIRLNGYWLNRTIVKVNDECIIFEVAIKISQVKWNQSRRMLRNMELCIKLYFSNGADLVRCLYAYNYIFPSPCTITMYEKNGIKLTCLTLEKSSTQVQKVWLSKMWGQTLKVTMSTSLISLKV